MVLTDAAKKFRHDVGQQKLINARLIRAEGIILPMCNSVAVVVNLVPPDKKVRDIDNVLKPLLDSLQHAGILEDDRFVDTLVVRRQYADKHQAYASVMIAPIDEISVNLWAV